MTVHVDVVTGLWIVSPLALTWAISTWWAVMAPEWEYPDRPDEKDN